MDYVQEIVMRGKTDALERGLASGLMLAAQVREDAQDMLKIQGVPDDLKKRLEVLAQAADAPVTSL